MRVCLLLIVCACLPGLTKDFNVPPGRIISTQYPAAQIMASGAPNPGETIRFDLYAPEGRGRRYQLATSFGPGPTWWGAHRIPLTVDPLLVLSLGGRAPRIFEGYAGTFDAYGRAVAKLHIPRGRAMVGLRLYTAFVTLGNNTITTGEKILAVSPAYVLGVVKR
jgi:hypothetical protein